MQAATAAFEQSAECPVWAVLDGPSGRVMPGCCAAPDGREEPNVFDAARCTNVCSWRGGQKRDKIKPSFAKGLWHKIFNDSGVGNTCAKNDRFWRTGYVRGFLSGLQLYQNVRKRKLLSAVYHEPLNRACSALFKMPRCYNCLA